MTDHRSLVQSVIAKVCGVAPEHVRPEVRLTELGIDSLTASEVLVELEIRLNTELPVDLLRRLDTVDTVGDVMTQVEAALRGSAPV